MVKINCLDCGKEVENKSNRKRCLECDKRKDQECKKNYILNNREKHRKATETWRKNHLEEKSNIQKNYAKENKEIIIAHRLAKKIPKNKSCDICGDIKKLERHHWRYDKPLIFNTLCQFCHNVQHGRGEIPCLTS